MARFFRAAIFMAFLLYAGNAFAAGGTCPSGANYPNSTGQLVTLASLGVTNCYFIAANGSDSSSGSTESAPWAHLPGMSTCASSCAAVTPAAGMGFIFRGGDTWTGANFGINWQWGGTSGSPIYIGVDPTWYSGSSWARPIWTCGGATCAGANNGYYIQLATNKSHNILDNIELTGLFETATNHPNYVNLYGTYNMAENLYAHGWGTDITPPNASSSQVIATGSGEPATGTTVRYSVADGSDTSQNMMYLTHVGVPIAYGNVMRYLQTGLDGCGDEWHDNLFEYMVPGIVTVHQDAYQHTGSCDGSTYLIYNNVLRHMTASSLFTGAGHFWFNGLGNCGAIGTPLTDCTGYAFNNVMYDVAPGNQVNMGGHYGVNYGTIYFFNNTIQCGSDSNPGDCDLGDNGNAQNRVASNGTMGIYSINNHWIAADQTSVFCCSGPAGSGSRGSCYSFTCSETAPLYQTVTTASAQAYDETGNHAFQPTSGSGLTVGAGTNESSLCNAISGIDSVAGSACMNATSYACAYNATNHTVSCPASTMVARPPSGAWDIGAYQFSSSIQTSVPGAPKGLTASVQ